MGGGGGGGGGGGAGGGRGGGGAGGRSGRVRGVVVWYVIFFDKESIFFGRGGIFL